MSEPRPRSRSLPTRLTAFERSLVGKCSVCDEEAFFDPCPPCQEVMRAAGKEQSLLRAVIPSRLSPVSGFDVAATSCDWPPRHRPSLGVEAWESRIDPFAGIRLPTPAEVIRGMACYWDDENEWAQRMTRRAGAAYCARWGVDPFSDGDA